MTQLTRLLTHQCCRAGAASRPGAGWGAARRPAAWLVAGLAGWLAGCASAPPVVAPPPPATIEAPTVSPGTAPARPPGASYAWSDKLGAAAQKLKGGLQGNNVAVSQTTDQRLWVSLPADSAFATGRTAVKAPATGWLDQVAVALRELPRSEVQIVSDADGGGNDNSARVLALDRAASARDWLVIRGVPPQRVSVAGRTGRVGVPADQRRLDILIGERARPGAEPAK